VVGGLAAEQLLSRRPGASAAFQSSSLPGGIQISNTFMLRARRVKHVLAVFDSHDSLLDKFPILCL